jgi:hypothetical protein
MDKQRKYICDDCKAMAAPLKAHECKGCRKLKAAAWFQRNKAKVNARHSAWKKRNPHKVAESDKTYRAGHRAEINAYHRSRWLIDPEFRKNRVAKNRRWRHENPETFRTQKKRIYSNKVYGEFGESHRVLLDLKSEIKSTTNKERETVCREPIKTILRRRT